MSPIPKVVCVLLLHVVLVRSRFNLDLTDWKNEIESDVALQHDCLHVAASIENENDPRQIISYCMSEWPSKWDIEQNSSVQSFSFAALFELNITSQQLYLWAAPMDAVEDYQDYLNRMLTSKARPSLSSRLFYNCTLPWFGPLCQYSFDGYESYPLPLSDIVYHFYSKEYRPTTLTCYTHLQCNHSSRSGCLDWSDICNGEIDCMNDGVDEEYCWQVQINECQSDEFRCDSGECISKIFDKDYPYALECIDQSDELRTSNTAPKKVAGEPIFYFEDVRCAKEIQNEMLFKGHCSVRRDNLNTQALFSNEPRFVRDDCWLAFRCHFNIPSASQQICNEICVDKPCQEIINETCPDILYIPDVPLFFGHVYLAYTKKAAVETPIRTHPPQYVCYNDQLCSGFFTNATLLSFNGSTCRRPADFPLKFSPAFGRYDWFQTYVKPVYKRLYNCNTMIDAVSTVCNSSIMYRCFNSSKCISNNRVGDNLIDCDYADDEQQTVIDDMCSKDKSKMFFYCTSTKRCISFKKVDNGLCDCGRDPYGLCDDEDTNRRHLRTHISFPTICDGFTELFPVTIGEKNETDETGCELWHCNNTYTRCDGFWNCLNGADEVDCGPSPLLNCSLSQHRCVSPDTHRLTCLSLDKANDGHIDCLGATDEPTMCRSSDHVLDDVNFYCRNHTSQLCVLPGSLCFGNSKCGTNNDKQLCDQTGKLATYTSKTATGCNRWELSDVQTFLCDRPSDKMKKSNVHFSLDAIRYSRKNTIEQALNKLAQRSSVLQINVQHKQRCHRGLPLRVWLDKEQNLTNTTCLCPPSFYGSICQYQNQRVSLTMKFQAYSDSRRTIFAIVVSLIDNSTERTIHSHQQLTYLYIRDCRMKFNLYLLYATRPKDDTKQYSVHIDIYEKVSLTYRGSLLIPLKFHFLPVHRIAVQLNIPRGRENIERCANQPCEHGQCVDYFDDPHGATFCRCDPGWSGRYCTIPYTCRCSDGSLCIGLSANNRSLCVCPLHKFGSRCSLDNDICQSTSNATCYNGGKCVPVDELMIFDKKFFCICPKQFSGERCEVPVTKITLSFHYDIVLPQSMMVHFIDVRNEAPPVNGSTFTTVALNEKIATVYWARLFHIAFLQLSNQFYYLITVQKTSHLSATIVKRIDPSDRCKHISEVLDERIAQSHHLRRIKYYHLPCQLRSSHVPCFYDDSHFCLCSEFGYQRLANCFEFNYTKRLDCYGYSNCQNGAQCLQDRLACPQTSVCVCQACFYGIQCQFSSKGFDLLLDGILGYHLQPHRNIIRQPPIIQFSVALAVVMIAVGLVDGFLSVTTFKSKELRKVGCGFYLFGSSIATLFITIVFALKFFILIAAQITYISNRSFLNVQCISIDCLLRIGVNMDQWLNACVAIDRALAAIKGVRFEKKKSKRAAKYVITFLLLFTISTSLHDPFHRRLLEEGDDDDDKEKRIWCIVTYSSGFQTLNSFMNIFHFFTPLLINLSSAGAIILITARQRTTSQTRGNYREILREQLQQHRHLLIAPLVLSMLAMPRLIISFVSGCMKSSNDSWLFLAGYFVSFVPSLLTFVVFVLPSTSYKTEFLKGLGRYRTMIYALLHRSL